MPDIEKIMAYESGEMEMEEVVEFFQDGIDSSWVWQLQGSYGRMARQLMDAGLIWETV
jgi:hypothetical protein